MHIGEPLHTLDIILDADLASGDRRALLDTATGILRANKNTLLMRANYEELLLERESILELRGYVIPEDHELSWSAHENNWNPAHEASLDLWYGPEALYVVDDKVAVAEDKTGKKIDVYNTDNGDQPALSTISLNGFKGMTFANSEVLYHDPNDNDPDIGTYDSTVDVSENGLLIAAMVNYGADENSNNNLIVGTNAGNGGAGGSNDWNLRTKDNVDPELYRCDWGNQNTDNPNATAPDGNDFIVWGPVSGSGVRTCVNGTNIVNGSIGTLNNIAGGRILNIGGMVNSTSVASGFTGTIYEVIVFKTYNSDSLRNKIEGHFAHKYGLTGNLPSDHPYKSTPPKAKG